jgi:hypothetical protein
VDQTLAFEIGAVFFLVVLFMAGTKVGGVFPRVGKNIKYALIAGVALVIVYGAIHLLPQASGGLLSLFDTSPSSAPSSAASSGATAIHPDPSAPPASTAHAAAAPKRVNPNAGVVSEVEYVIHEPAPATEKIEAKPEVVAAEPDAGPAKEKRGTRVFKSIGHALHLGKKDKSTADPQ